jgi:outer membrane protein OmpA-like peptidoglycan-associated protein
VTHRLFVIGTVFALFSCGGAPSAESTAVPAEGPKKGELNEFKLNRSDAASEARGARASEIKPTRTQAAVTFVVVDKDRGPIRGVVISLTAPGGKKYYTEETDAEGYAELLVPVGQEYDVVYLSLGRREIATKVTVPDEPNQKLKLTLRYKRYAPPALLKSAPGAATTQRFVLKGIYFDTGKATIRDESFAGLDSVVEYMAHKKLARIVISGHTDNVGSPKSNKVLSAKRAQSCRDYLISKGIDGSRVEAVGYGDEQPIASNDTEQGRQQNRRIEATEL